jgi:hypothetical protein
MKIPHAKGPVNYTGQFGSTAKSVVSNIQVSLLMIRLYSPTIEALNNFTCVRTNACDQIIKSRDLEMRLVNYKQEGQKITRIVIRS